MDGVVLITTGYMGNMHIASVAMFREIDTDCSIYLVPSLN